LYEQDLRASERLQLALAEKRKRGSGNWRKIVTLYAGGRRIEIGALDEVFCFVGER